MEKGPNQILEIQNITSREQHRRCPRYSASCSLMTQSLGTLWIQRKPLWLNKQPKCQFPLIITENQETLFWWLDNKNQKVLSAADFKTLPSPERRLTVKCLTISEWLLSKSRVHRTHSCLLLPGKSHPFWQTDLF